MADFWKPTGPPGWIGIRTTLTLSGHNTVLASTSVKDRRGRWDDWTRLAPMTRLEVDHPPTTTEQALWLLHEATYAAWLDFVSPPH